MKVTKIDYTGHTMADLRGATIYLADGTRINAWYDPKTFRLDRANSLPKDPSKPYSLMGYRKRDLTNKNGVRLAELFKADAQKNEHAAIKAIEDEAARKESDRLAILAEQQHKRACAVADVIMSYDRDITPGNAMGIVSMLIDAGFIDRNG